MKSPVKKAMDKITKPKTFKDRKRQAKKTGKYGGKDD